MHLAARGPCQKARHRGGPQEGKLHQTVVLPEHLLLLVAARHPNAATTAHAREHSREHSLLVSEGERGLEAARVCPCKQHPVHTCMPHTLGAQLLHAATRTAIPYNLYGQERRAALQRRALF